MGLYLCIFDEDDEIDGVQIGSYADFALFRDTIRDRLEGGTAGSRFPILMLHSDCDGEWSADEARELRRELEQIAVELAKLPPEPLKEGWKREVARTFGVKPESLLACFFDVDGEPLLERLIGLCEVSRERDLPILFQ